MPDLKPWMVKWLRGENIPVEEYMDGDEPSPDRHIAQAIESALTSEAPGEAVAIRLCQDPTVGWEYSEGPELPEMVKDRAEWEKNGWEFQELYLHPASPATERE